MPERSTLRPIDNYKLLIDNELKKVSNTAPPIRAASFDYPGAAAGFGSETAGCESATLLREHSRQLARPARQGRERHRRGLTIVPRGARELPADGVQGLAAGAR